MIHSSRIYLLCSGLLLTAGLLLSVLGCRYRDNGSSRSSREADPDKIFLDYSLEGSEDDPEVSLLMQYRLGGQQGATLYLEEPAGVSFDGQPVAGDSAATTGTYYEVILPPSQFAEAHTVTFKSRDGRLFTDTIMFPVFSMTGGPADSVRGDEALLLELEGLPAVSPIHVLITDTAAFSRGIDRVDTVVNGRLRIPASEMGVLLPGPVHLELFREEERGLRQTPRQGGRLRVSYSLRRSFEIIR